MASIFGHSVIAGSLKLVLLPDHNDKKLWVMGVICSILPDVDIIMFAFGFEYSHPLGHRGFTHSLFFALVVALLIAILFFRQHSFETKKFWILTFFFFLTTASHGVFDAMTDGGLGIAFFAPFDNTRYFLPFQPIHVSPIGIFSFFSNWGVRVLVSELIWIGIPCVVFVSISKIFRLIKKS